MPFEVPASKASIKQNIFEFTIPGSKKVYSLPLLQYLNADLATEMAVISPKLQAMQETGGKDPEVIAAVSSWQRKVFESYAPGVYAKLTSDQISALAAAWREASSVSMGESQSSAEN